jgi:hypothetical protein
VQSPSKPSDGKAQTEKKVIGNRIKYTWKNKIRKGKKE